MACCFDPVRRLAVEGFGRGTLPYMAPEQLDPELGGVDIRTDVHALGVLLFQILTGQLPHEVPEGNRSGYVQAIGQGPRRRLREVTNNPPTGLTEAQWQSLEDIVGRAMAVKQEQRHRYPSDLAKALEEWQQAAMPSENAALSSGSVQVPGNITGSIITTGHNNVINVNPASTAARKESHS